MVSIGECRFFHRTPTFDQITRKSSSSNHVKFKRAFQFLQLLLFQRVYGIDVISCSHLCSLTRRQTKNQQEKKHCCQVFLGGSCNPTTWRRDQAIPYFQSRSVSFYNPQVSDWTPDLVEIEHRAKELAPLLFFVIDPDTRALASILEVCYLAALGRSIIVVMNPLPDREHTKFIQLKKSTNEQEDEDDYTNVLEARQLLLTLLRTINIPIFNDVRLALECAAFILETTNRTVVNSTTIDESDNEHHENCSDDLYPTPPPSADIEHSRPSSVVVIRSLSNKKSFEWPDDFYRQMQQSTPLSPTVCRRRHSTETNTLEQQLPSESPFLRSLFLTVGNHPNQTKFHSPTSQLSCSTTESDDDGYWSLASSNRGLSASSASISSESFEGCTDHIREDNNSSGCPNTSSSTLMNSLLSTFSPYVPFVSSKSEDEPSSSVSNSLFVLCTLPFRFIKNALLAPVLPSAATITVSTPTEESVDSDSSRATSPPPPSSSSTHLFDVYIASGEYDQCWLNTFAIPCLDKAGFSHVKRQSYHEDDQLDAIYDIHVRKQSHLLYYLINDHERLSYLVSELAFLIGERKHQIVIYLQQTITDEILMAPCEKRDIQRSRKYLEELAREEKIILYHCREESWKYVLDFVSHDH